MVETGDAELAGPSPALWSPATRGLLGIVEIRALHQPALARRLLQDEPLLGITRRNREPCSTNCTAAVEPPRKPGWKVRIITSGMSASSPLGSGRTRWPSAPAPPSR